MNVFPPQPVHKEPRIFCRGSFFYGPGSCFARVLMLLFLVSSCVFLAHGSCRGDDFESPDMPTDLARIKEQGVLRVAVLEKMSPPFVLERNGVLTGYDIDICRDMAAQLGVDVRFVRVSGNYDEIIRTVAEGRADIGMCETSKSPRRSQAVFFSHIYFVSGSKLVINRLSLAHLEIALMDVPEDKRQAGLLKLCDSERMSMAVLEGSIFVHITDKLFPDVFKVMVASEMEGAEMVYVGDADMALVSGSNYYLLAHQQPELFYKIKALDLEIEDPLSIAVNPGLPDLLRWIDDYLETEVLPRDMTLEDMIATYIDVADHEGVDAAPDGSFGGAGEEDAVGELGIIVSLHLVAALLLWLLLVRRRGDVHWLLSPVTVLTAMILGGVTGGMLPYLSVFFSRPASVYMGFWQMCVLPIMATAIITSLYRLLSDGKNNDIVRGLLVATVVLLFVAASTGMLLGVLGQPGADFPETAQETLMEHMHGDLLNMQTSGLFDVFMDVAGNVIPDNVFKPLVENRSLAVLFMSVLFGIALAKGSSAGQKTVVAMLETVLHAFTSMVQASLYLLPFALYALAFDFVADAGVDLLMATLRLVFWLIVAMLPAGVFALCILKKRLQRSCGQIVREFGSIFLLSFSARSSVISMPIGLSILGSCRRLNADRAVMVFPFSLLVCQYAFAVFFAMTPVFIAQVFGVELSLFHYVAIGMLAVLATLAAIGTVGMAYVMLLSIVCVPLGLPVDPAVLVGLAAVSIAGPFMAGVQAVFGCGVSALLAGSDRDGAD